MFEMFGCPMHFGLSNIENTEALASLNSRFPELNIAVVPERARQESGDTRLKNLNSVVATCGDIAAAARAIIERGNRPLFIGGDHSSAMGTVSASADGRPDMGLIWIDAHTDINTESTTVTGNIHGMPVAALTGMGDSRLCRIYNDSVPKIKKEHVVFFGTRDMDPPEAETVERLGIKVFTYSEIEERGLKACLDSAIEYLSCCSGLHVSFDLDAADPNIITGVSVPVQGGFTTEQVAYQFSELFSRCDVVSADIVEYNPVRDRDGQSAALVKSLVDFVMAL